MAIIFDRMLRIFSFRNVFVGCIFFLLSAPIFAGKVNVAAGKPARILITTGTPQQQHAAVNTKFANPFSVTVTDSLGAPVTGALVMFAAPRVGASGTFLSKGNTSIQVVTDAHGVATTSFFANATVGGPYIVAASVSGVAISVHFSLTNTTDTASTMIATNGPSSLSQNAVVNAEFLQPLSITTTDIYGDPIAEQSVKFRVTCVNGGACGTFLANGGTSISIASNAQGIAAPVVMANAIAGTYTVSASVKGVVTPITFSMTNTVGRAVIIKTRGTTQSTSVGHSFSAPLRVIVSDAYNNPIPGAQVTLTAQGPRASGFFPANGKKTITLMTDSTGTASSLFTANNVPGTYEVSAITDGASATFNLTNTLGTGLMSITSGSAQEQRVVVKQSLPASSFSLTEKDKNGLPVQGVSVTFTAPNQNAGGVFDNGSNVVTVTSNSDGVAAAPAFIANTIAGAYDVVASDETNSVDFHVTNMAGSASTIAITQGTPQKQSSVVNDSLGFAHDLSVTVTDQYGNAVPNTLVTFTASCTSNDMACGTFGFDGSSTTQLTASNGVATAGLFKANTHAGSYTIRASVNGVATPVIFNLSNTADITPYAITINGGNNQHVAVGSIFPAALSVRVTDVFGNPIPNQSVVFAVPSTQLVFAEGDSDGVSVVTNSEGIATATTATAGKIAGDYIVEASAGSASVNFTASNNIGVATVKAITSAVSQTATVGKAFATPLAVSVQDQYNNPAVNTVVTFTANCLNKAACGTFANGSNRYAAVTDAKGIIIAPAFRANTVAGSYTVTATVATSSFVAAGAGSSATFNLTNSLSATNSLVLTSGTLQNQTQTVGGAFSPFSVTLLDENSRPISGVSVTFTAPSSGAHGTFSNGTPTTTVVTDANGIATTSAFTANTVSGTYTVTATPAITTAPTNLTFNLTNTAGSATAIVASSGSPQSTAVNSSFGTTISATVKDSYGNGVPNILVTFAAPTSLQSAIFLPNGNNTIRVLSDANGVATAPTLNANTIAGAYQLSASAPGVSTPAQFSLTNTALTTPAFIAITSGTPQSQSATVLTAFHSPLSVTVTDLYGNVVSGASVTFVPPSGVGFNPSCSLSSNPVTTNSTGIAAPIATANHNTGVTVGIGAYTVTARVSTGSGTASTNFSLTNTPGAPNSVVLFVTAQTTVVATPFSGKLNAIVQDANSNPVPNINVTFAIGSSLGGASATFSGSPVITTNSEGVALSPVLTANTVTGTYAPSATASGGIVASVFGTLTNTAGTPASIAVTSGTSTSQSAVVGAAFSPGLSVTVKDKYSNLASDVPVTFTPPSSSSIPSGTVSGSTTTNGSGIAAPTFTANTHAGGPYTVSASVSGVATQAYFAFTNTAGAPHGIELVGSTSRSTITGTAFSPFQVRVLDSGSSPVSGAIVTFTANDPTRPAGANGTFPGGGVSSAAITDANGIATAPTFTANCISDEHTYRLGVSVQGVGENPYFVLTNTEGTPTTVSVNAGSPQSAVAGTVFSTPLSALVVNQGGCPVSVSVPVTFAAPSSGASGIFTTSGTNVETDITNSSGIATASTFTANSNLGSYSVSASGTGLVGSANFSLANIINVTSSGALMLSNSVPGGSDTSGTGSVTVTNISSSPITGGFTVNLAGTSLTVSNNGCSGTLAANSSCIIAFTSSDVTTDSTGDKTFTISNPGANTLTIHISALNVIVMSPPLTDTSVQMLLVDQCSKAQVLEIINNSTTDISNISASVSGGLTGANLTNYCSTIVLQKNQICMVLVATNTATLNSQGTVTINNTTIPTQHPAITAKVVPKITISGITPGTTEEPAASGDVVFYIDSNADAATSCNQVKVGAKEAAAGAVAQVWASVPEYQTTVIPVPGAQYLSDGSLNTVATVKAEEENSEPGLDDANAICLNYTETGLGFTNWYLPAICELGTGAAGCADTNTMYAHISALGTVPASLNVLWSSTENNATTAWLQETKNGGDPGGQASYSKDSVFYSDQSSIGVWCARSYTASSP